jgi:septum site-determining protein MinC
MEQSKGKGKGKNTPAHTQYVVLKGHKDGINVMLDAKVHFDELKKSLRDKVAGAKRFFEGANATITFKGRSLSEKQEQDLLNIIMSETTLDVSFVESEGFTLKPEKPAPVTANSSTHAPVMESETAFYMVGLRSGQQVRYKGSVVIVGDVNPGSKIEADGNVVILGALKGVAEAGAMGDNTCYISALHLAPTQLRIAGAIVPIDPKEIANSKNNGPSRAYIDKTGRFVIEQL